MPIIQYPQLENELFCNIYYLRHLCDQKRFPDWPIKDPVRLFDHVTVVVVLSICMYSAYVSDDVMMVSQVKLLKDVLDEWKQEVDKKPPEMSVDEAYTKLGLKKGVGGYVAIMWVWYLEYICNKGPFCVKCHAFDLTLASYISCGVDLTLAGGGLTLARLYLVWCRPDFSWRWTHTSKVISRVV